MPPVKPSEKTGHEGEWWRKDPAHSPDQSNVDPQYPDHTDAGKNLEKHFDQSQRETKFPT